jgi:hypothetical protein
LICHFRLELDRASLFTLHQTFENTSSFSKVHLTRGHVNLEIDDRHEHSTVHANPVEEAGFLVASSGAAELRKSFSDQGFTVFDRGNFGLGASFRNLEDLNLQFRAWLDQVANPRTHATTRRVVAEHFAEELPHLQALPVGPFQAVLQLERRITRDGMISLHGNLL